MNSHMYNRREFLNRAAFEKLEVRTAVRAVVELGERTNKFVQDSKPWEKVASAPEEARRDLSTVADVAYLVATLLSPVVPKFADDICAQLVRSFTDYSATVDAFDAAHRKLLEEASKKK